MTPRTKNLIAFLEVVLLVFVLHVLATKLSFYYIFWWYDSMLHILGGVAIAFFGLLFIKNYKYIIIPIFALGVGISWEVFERLGHIWWPSYMGYGATWDTIFDILCAILGALIIIGFKHTWQTNNITRT